MLLTALYVGKVIAQQAMPASGADHDQNGRQDVLVLPDGLGGPAVQPLEQPVVGSAPEGVAVGINVPADVAASGR
jgi:hypothetical protein